MFFENYINRSRAQSTNIFRFGSSQYQTTNVEVVKPLSRR